MSLPSGLIASPSNLVFYGIFTRTSELIAAGRAFDTIQPAFRTISLIRIRRRANTLKFRMTRGRRVPAVGWVPDEVWEMVKGHLIEEGLADARAELQEELHCYDCEQGEVETRRGKGPSGRRPKYDVVADAVCEERAVFQQAHVGRPHWIDFADPNERACTHKQATAEVWAELARETRSELLDALLRSYGLRSGLNSPPATRRSASTTTLSIVEAEHWPRPDIPPPPDAERRIARFLDAWQVNATHEHAEPADDQGRAEARMPRLLPGNTTFRLHANLRRIA